jgi:hypothetical protein
MTDSSSVTRRSVLQLSGAALAGVAATGSASASCLSGENFRPGDPVSACNPDDGTVLVYSEGCPLGDVLDEVGNGTCGELVESCTEYETWWYVEWDPSYYKDGWVRESDLDYC